MGETVVPPEQVHLHEAFGWAARDTSSHLSLSFLSKAHPFCQHLRSWILGYRMRATFQFISWLRTGQSMITSNSENSRTILTPSRVIETTLFDRSLVALFFVNPGDITDESWPLLFYCFQCMGQCSLISFLLL